MTIHTPRTVSEPDIAGLTRFLSTGSGGETDVPPDVEPGSDADIDRSGEEGDGAKGSEPGSEATEPTPGKGEPDGIASGDGEQMDDNIDDLGRRPDGTMQDQPGIGKL